MLARAIEHAVAEAIRAETETTDERTPENAEFVERVTVLNVRRAMQEIRDNSRTLRASIDDGEVLLLGGVYDVETGHVEFLDLDSE